MITFYKFHHSHADKTSSWWSSCILYIISSKKSEIKSVQNYHLHDAISCRKANASWWFFEHKSTM